MSEPMDLSWRLLKMPQEAKDYATQIHEEQMYGEQPYMTHVEDVASGFDDPHLQRIAYLHDTVEDSKTGIGEIHERFGEDVGHAVDALTRKEGEQYFDYINRVKEHPEATQVKLADLHSNLKNNPNESLARRYQKAIGILTNKSEPMDLAYDAIKKNLNRWFKEKWVDVSRKNKDGKHPPCGRSKAKKGSKGYPKCRPSVKVSDKTPKTSGSMSEGQKQAATKRKRAKKQGVGGKPTIVKSPMDIAMQLLKLELAPPMTQGVEEEVPMQENIPTVDVDTMDGNDCCQKVKQAIVQHLEDIKKYPHNNSDDLDKRIKIIMNMSCEELQNQDYYSYWQEQVCSFNSDFQNVMTGEPMDITFRLLKASQQMKLYNYIEDYPGMEPVTAFRGIHGKRVAQNMSEGVQPQHAEKWHENPYEKIAPFPISGKGSWWAKGNTPQAHEGASAFAAANDPVGMVMGYRGKLPKPIDRMGIDPSPALLGMHVDEYDSAPMDFEESFAQHQTNLDPDKLVWTKPSGIWEGM